MQTENVSRCKLQLVTTVSNRDHSHMTTIGAGSLLSRHSPIDISHSSLFPSSSVNNHHDTSRVWRDSTRVDSGHSRDDNVTDTRCSKRLHCILVDKEMTKSSKRTPPVLCFKKRYYGVPRQEGGRKKRAVVVRPVYVSAPLLHPLPQPRSHTDEVGRDSGRTP